MIKGGEGRRDAGSEDVEGRMGGWNNEWRGGRGGGFEFYLLTGWRTAAAGKLGFKTVSALLNINGAFIIRDAHASDTHHVTPCAFPQSDGLTNSLGFLL